MSAGKWLRAPLRDVDLTLAVSGACVQPVFAPACPPPPRSSLPAALHHSHNLFIVVTVDGSSYPSFPISIGVPQGPVLSPPFLSFVHDLANNCIHSISDDSAPYSSFKYQLSSLIRSLLSYLDCSPQLSVGKT